MCYISDNRSALDNLLSNLASALRDRLSLIANEESRSDVAAHTERLRIVSEKLDRIERQLPPGTDPQLRHFLQRRSYSKALDHLTGLGID